MKLGIILWILSIFGLLYNSSNRNFIFIFICLELIFLSLSLILIFFSIFFDDLYSQFFSLSLIIVAGAESAIGLSILVSYYRLRGSILL